MEKQLFSWAWPHSNPRHDVSLPRRLGSVIPELISERFGKNEQRIKGKHKAAGFGSQTKGRLAVLSPIIPISERPDNNENGLKTSTRRQASGVRNRGRPRKDGEKERIG
jgi:hypothetical protein